MKTVIFEELVKRKSAVSSNIFSFLGVTPVSQVATFLKHLDRTNRPQKHSRAVLTYKKQLSLPQDLTSHQVDLNLTSLMAAI